MREVTFTWASVCQVLYQLQSSIFRTKVKEKEVGCGESARCWVESAAALAARVQVDSHQEGKYKVAFKDQCCLQSWSWRQGSHGSVCRDIFAFHLSYERTARGETAAQLKGVSGWMNYICCQKQPLATQAANCQTQTRSFHICFKKKK